MIAQTPILPPPDFTRIMVATTVEHAPPSDRPIYRHRPVTGPSEVRLDLPSISGWSSPSHASLWTADLATRLQRLRDLTHGWDGPGSRPIKPWLLNKAARLINDALASSQYSVAPFLVPGGDGSVQIEWHTKSGEIELDLAIDGTYSIWIHDRLTGNEVEATDERAVSLFSRWAAWYSSSNNYESNGTVTADAPIFGASAEFFVLADNSIT